MPLSGFIKTFSSKTSLLIFFLIAGIPLYGLLLPKSALAAFSVQGGRCIFTYGSSSGNSLTMEVDYELCTSQTNGACASLDNCSSATVPGSGSNGCNTGGGPLVSYIFGNGNNNPPTGILFDAVCSATWSEGVDGQGHRDTSKDLDLNIGYLEKRADGKGYWTDIKNSTTSRPNKDFKITNNNRTRSVSLSDIKAELQDYSKPHVYGFYPNCADNMENALDSDCYATKTLGPAIIDNSRPNCSVTTTYNSGTGNYEVRVNGTDSGRGVAQVGVSLYQINGSGSQIGNEIVPANSTSGPSTVVDNGSYSYTFNIPRNTLTEGNGYKAIGKVWDLKGIVNKEEGMADSSNPNYNTCSTQMRCVMPTPIISQVASCTPLPAMRFASVGIFNARNFRPGGSYCDAEYVTVSATPPTGNPQNFTYPNYYNRNIVGWPSADIPWGFKKTGGSTEDLILNPSSNYYLSYYDTSSGQSIFSSFRTPAVCSPSGPPSITEVPQCIRDQSDTNTSLAKLVWNTPSNKGGGDVWDISYELQVSTKSNFNPSVVPSYSIQPAQNPTYPSTISIGLAQFRPDGYDPGASYYYRLRARGWGGYSTWSTYGPVSLGAIPKAPTNLNVVGYGATGSNPPHMNASWSDPNPSYSQVNSTGGWKWKRGSRTGSTNRGTNSFVDSDSALSCNGSTQYSYTVWGTNLCGDGPSATDSASCPANRAPTCGGLEYYNGSSWVALNSAGIVRDPSTKVQVRRVSCSDPDSNPLTYSWTVSCGSASPATWNSSNTTTFTFPTGNGLGCDITSAVRDSLNARASDASSIMRTYPLPGVGTHTLSPDSRSIERLANNSGYATGTGGTQNIATMRYVYSGYSNPTVAGAVNSSPKGQLTINTSATLPNGVINICNPTYGNCKFSNDTGTISNITAANNTSSPYIITVSFDTTAKLNAVKEVFLDTANTARKYGMQVDFTATGANGQPIPGSPKLTTGNPVIDNNKPYCAGISFSPPSPLNGGTVRITVSAADDWGLKGMTINYAKPGGSQTAINSTNYTNYFGALNPANPRSGTLSADWNISSTSIAGYYNIYATITDTDGGSTTCLANASTGSENVGDPNDPPEIMIDKTAPNCTAFNINDDNPAAVVFTGSATDPTSSGVASGLETVSISYKKKGAEDSTYVSIPALSRTISPIAQNANYTSPAYNALVLPSGQYTFRSTWTDEAGNPSAATVACTKDFERGSKISGKVFLNTGTNGEFRRSYSKEATGTDFIILTKENSLSAATGAAWANVAGGTTCNATYPGVAGSGSCDARVVTSAEYVAASAPIAIVKFPTLTGTNVPKYKCEGLKVFNTLTTPSWTQKRIFKSSDPSPVVPVCDNATKTCTCSYQLSVGDITVNNTSVTPYDLDDIWPTHLEFDLSYNSDQLHGFVRDENGNAVTTTGSGSGVKVGSGSAVNVSAGNYSSPVSSSGDNSADYARTGVSQTVSYNDATGTLDDANSQKLCIFVSRSDFANPASGTPDANTDRTNALNAFKSTSVGNIARGLNLSGWSVVADKACTTTLAPTSGVMSPKLQNQTNIIVAPKVKITGKIYYVNSDNLCSAAGGETTWGANLATDDKPTLGLSFATSDPTNNPLSETTTPFFTSDADSTYDLSNASDSTYTFYVNGLPTKDWATWAVNRKVTFNGSNADKYTYCGDGVINVGQALTNYPVGNVTINAPLVVYIKETNDWWQTYNGGVHALNGLTDAVPVDVDLPLETGGFQMHTIVGVPNNGIYDVTGAPNLIKGTFRTFNSGGLVTTTGPVSVLTGFHSSTNTKNWRITDSESWKNPNMKAMRLPFADGTNNNTVSNVVNKINELGKTGWKTSSSNISGASSTKIVLSGDQTFNATTYGTVNYVVVDGKLTINGDLKGDSDATDKTLFITAKGDVTISGDVGEINAYIYTPGNITINSKDGPDKPSEKVLKVYGGLYAGKNVINYRDIENTPENFGYPSVQVMFNPALIISSRKDTNFPSQLKESNVYWTQ